MKTEDHCNCPQDTMPQSSNEDSGKTDDEPEEEDYEGVFNLFGNSDKVITSSIHDVLDIGEIDRSQLDWTNADTQSATVNRSSESTSILNSLQEHDILETLTPDEKHEELKETSDNPKGTDIKKIKDTSDNTKDTDSIKVEQTSHQLLILSAQRVTAEQQSVHKGMTETKGQLNNTCNSITRKCLNLLAHLTNHTVWKVIQMATEQRTARQCVKNSYWLRDLPLQCSGQGVTEVPSFR
ncbi:uncharacterized protein LOC119966597 [Scyliorhinus canicula]|uniref:uncharacterized protein LOC119966597 n=1 Tax=Scyliorhinus canicula TaxID=7830 RepID=UPI0018F42673|nr:uncharacterized protein LOC119966597 [Scyliorhinus canicula]